MTTAGMTLNQRSCIMLLIAVGVVCPALYTYLQNRPAVHNGPRSSAFTSHTIDVINVFSYKSRLETFVNCYF